MRNLPFSTSVFADVFCLLMLPAGAQTKKTTRPVSISIILDTDIGPDYDDAGAMAMLHAMADNGECRILATIASNKHPRIAATLDVINTYFGRPDIPVGVPKSAGVNLPAAQGWDSVITAKYPHNLKTNAQAADAVSLYRQLLARQPDRSVTIVTIGFLTNMADLWQSKADRFSALAGKDLIRQKVKRLVCMAGKFPVGTEFNVEKDAAASKIVFDNWNTPIVFSGFEIGEKVFTGIPLIQSDIQKSPVKDVYDISIPKGGAEDKNGRMSWDQTAVLVAVRGLEKFYTVKPGRFVCRADGSNAWNPAGKGHLYLVEKMPVPEITKIINGLMMHQPK